MKFDQYLRLKEAALANCLGEGKDYPDPGLLNPVELAYIGDVVFSSYVRLRILPNSPKVRILHDLCAKAVSAVCQAEAMRQLVPDLTEAELAVYRRGRNANSTVPKSASVQEYREATAFEALVGFLFLQGDEARCEELLERAFKITVAMQQK